MEDIRKARAGNEKALARLMRRHAPLVQMLAKRFEEMQDAFQAGCVGLMKAIRGFDEEKGCAFSTYAVPVILGEMKKTREKHFGWRREKQLLSANRYRDEMLREYGREPTVSEMAEKAGIKPAEMALLLECAKPVCYDEDGKMLSALPDPVWDSWQTRFFIRDILDRMPGEYSYVLKRRYVYHESQASLAGKMHVHQSWISRTEKKARLMFISAWQCT